MATSLPVGVQASGRNRQIRHTYRAGTLNKHRPLLLSGFLPQEAGDHGEANVSMVSTETFSAAQFSFVSADGEGHLGQDFHSAKPDEAMTDLDTSPT